MQDEDAKPLNSQHLGELYCLSGEQVFLIKKWHSSFKVLHLVAYVLKREQLVIEVVCVYVNHYVIVLISTNVEI